MDKITPEMLVEIFREILLAERGDTEALHFRLDSAMVTLLRELGYGEAMDMFEEAPKWYA